MRRLTYTSAARQNLVEIALGIAERSGSREAGSAFVAKLEARCEKLAALPGLLGTMRPELRPGIRSIVHTNYVIFFQYVGDGIEVVAILPGRRNLELLFEAYAANPH
ncbi:MAG: type II toxin-antitoxin system RelE/ParE family toxin [Sphingomonadales bacterium]|nr:MAG: type II toxin-antitoxin system RelE/ParE family toxin [Sphingomonadales bacterium]